MMETLGSIDWVNLSLWCVSIIFIVVGLAGTIVPALPGIPMIFVGAWIAAWIGHYEHITWITLIVLGILTIIGFAVDWVAQSMGAQRAGASKYGIWGSFIGTIIGLPMGLFGIFVMPLIGAFVGELVARRGLKVATNVGWATWVGMLLGTVLKVALSFIMIGIMMFALWF